MSWATVFLLAAAQKRTTRGSVRGRAVAAAGARLAADAGGFLDLTMKLKLEPCWRLRPLHLREPTEHKPHAENRIGSLCGLDHGAVTNP